MSVGWAPRRLELGDRIAHLRLDVIRIEYRGIGAHDETEGPDVGSLIDTTANRIFSERSAGSLVEFVVARILDWREITNEMIRLQDDDDAMIAPTTPITIIATTTPRPHALHVRCTRLKCSTLSQRLFCHAHSRPLIPSTMAITKPI